MRQVAGTLRLELAQYREMAAFAQFGSDLDATTQKMLARGSRLVEVLKQGQYRPLPVERQVLILYAATNGYVDPLPIEAIGRYERELESFMETQHLDVYSDILQKRELTDDLKKRLNQALDEFKARFVADAKQQAAS
jgi:F-type H+-transporting ATPase subunit alpha